MSHTVCFTGHRNIPRELYPRLAERLEEAVEEQIAAGAAVFRVGGALGFDTIAARCVLLARRRHPHIRLALILPYPSQSDGWSTEARARYERIKLEADDIRYIGQQYYRGILHARNRALVDGADVCIAYLCNSVGGTAYTASYALKSGVQLINLQDHLAQK